MSVNSILAEPKQRVEKPKQATLMILLFSHGKEPSALQLLYQRGDANDRILGKPSYPPMETGGPK